MKKKLGIIVLIFAVCSSVLLLRQSAWVNAATTITVNSTADASSNDGQCTLREAITAANTDIASGVAVGECAAGSGVGDTIEFDIAGAGPHTIAISSSLPTITASLTIDGYSETGAVANSAISPAPLNGTLMIEVDGSGIAINSGSCILSSNTDNITITGLVINNCGNSGISLYRSDNATITGNYIGTDVAGLVDEGNGRNYAVTSIGNGLHVEASNNTKIGGTNPADRNLVAGNQAGDIFIHNESNDANPSENNIIQGNYLGVGANGTTALPSGFADGLGNAILFGNSHNDLVGGTAAGAKNVVATSDEMGVSFRDGCTGSVVAGNYIGTDYTGAATLSHTFGTGHSTGGVHIAIVSNGGFTRPPHDITIGGTTAAARNVISGNSNAAADAKGVWLHDGAYNITVQGNYIGTTLTGLAALPNEIAGVLIEDTTNSHIIGGDSSAERNVISGNTGYGVQVGAGAEANQIQGNYIGTTAAGTAALPNGLDGVSISATANNTTIGGTTTAARNIISGNTARGVSILGTATNSLIQGNYIGTTAAGTAALPNGGHGISSVSTGTGNIIGGTVDGARNIISGNSNAGIEAGGSNLKVQGNYIGLSATGTAVIPNTATTAMANVLVAGINNTIGGTSPAARNVISGSPSAGVTVVGTTPFGGAQASGNVVQGNYVGTNTSGSVQAGFGNAGSGVQMALDAVNNIVGGTAAGAGNLIAGNGSGVLVVTYTAGTPAINNTILGNSIHSNSGGTISSIGIDLLQTANLSTYVNAGVTVNDANDIDFGGTNTGSNHYLNFPEISSVTSDDGVATFTYNLDINNTETGATGYRVEFFANDTADPTGYGQGQTYLGSDLVSGDVTGRQVTMSLPSGVSGAKFITATTTMTDVSSDGFGHTSEFGQNVLATLVAATDPAGTGGDLADTGINRLIVLVAGIVMIVTAGARIGYKKVFGNRSL